MSNDPSLVDNTVGAHDDVPPRVGPGTPLPKTPWYLSYILWTNIAALLSMLLPSVRDWLASNPVVYDRSWRGQRPAAVYKRRQIPAYRRGRPEWPVRQSGRRPPRPVATGADATSPVEDRSQDPNQDPSSMSQLRLLLPLVRIRPPDARPGRADGPAWRLQQHGCGPDSHQRSSYRRPGSSHPWRLLLVVDRTEHKLLWSQAAPEVVVAPVVQATSK